MIERQVFDNGLCLLTESMPAVRSISLGAWLTRGSRDESLSNPGIAHFVEHMLFKGTATRTAEGIAQEIDSIGGHLDAFTAKECVAYYIKVLDEHLPRAVAVLSDLLLNPAFADQEINREQNVVVEEIKMVEDTPDDFVHERVAPEDMIEKDFTVVRFALVDVQEEGSSSGQHTVGLFDSWAEETHVVVE